MGLATQADSQEDPGLEMEFEDNNGESASQAEAKKKVQAPPL